MYLVDLMFINQSFTRLQSFGNTQKFWKYSKGKRVVKFAQFFVKQSLNLEANYFSLHFTISEIFFAIFGIYNLPEVCSFL